MNQLASSGVTYNIVDPCLLWGKFWVEHSSEKTSHGYVHVERAPLVSEEDDPEGVEAIARLIYSRLAETQPWKRGLSSAILVRNNDKGNLLAQKILEIDPSIPIAFESQNPICDSPIIGTLLDLLVLSEHPLHSSAEWGHIKASSTITTLLYPDTSLPSIPHKIAQDCCKNGLSDTLRVWSSLLLKAVPQEKKFDALRDRFESLISAATEFSLDANRSGSMLEFRSFVYGKEQRTTASPQEVKILTQHRSKGLGFDQVFVPFFLDRKGNNVFEPSIGYHEYQHFLQTNEWILENVPGPLQSTFPVFAKAAREQNDAMTFEDFCTFYVAVTRPKSELFIALPPKKETKTKAKAPKTWSFPLFLESTLGSADFSLGDSLWYTKATIKEENAPKTSPSSSANKQPSKTQQPTPAITRNTPSRHHHFRQKASDLFRLSERAAERGTSLHERLAQIKWLETGVQPAGISPEEIDFRSDSALRRALTRPEGTVEVWRERSFEILRGHEWTSGTVDRVVVHGEGETRTLTIFDYKSDRQRPDESRDAFHTRLQDHYISQLEAYRAALSTLTGIPKARIRCALLLTSTLERLDLL